MAAEEFGLQGKVALVTGDGRFWSKYIASALAEAGADMAVAAGNSVEVEVAVGEALHRGRRAIAILTNLNSSFQVREMVEQVVAQFRKIDILVNCADLELAKPFLEITEEEWQRVMEANLTPLFLCCQAVGQHMLQQKKGRIINIVSGAAERGFPYGAAYCAAKGGVLQLTRSLALEWAMANIRVNAIGPGWFREEATPGEPQEQRLLSYIPLKRFGHPREIGSLAVYLASDASDFVSGQVFYVDGGVLSHA